MNEDWRAEAACSGVEGNLFFPDQGNDGAEAKAICARCPVRAECLDYALRAGERFGIWGGTSEKGRDRIRRAMSAREREALREDRRRPIVHGTAAGAAAHRRRGEVPCDSCRHAARMASRLTTAQARERAS